MSLAHRLVRRIARLGGEGVQRRMSALSFADAGHGFDPFGLHPDFIGFGDAAAGVLYDHYFRVKSYHSERIPTDGPAILAANHSGTLPMDGAMLWVDVLRKTSPPRAARAVADYFVSTLPFVSTAFARGGVVGGSRGNARALLEAGELLMIFPEGVPGIGKPFSERYKLQDWRKGHCELAIRHSAPVVPVGIVGPEEQMPQLARIKVPWGGPLPYIPVPATPFPLPVRYHILYGEPLRFDEDYTPDQADDPDVVRQAASRVKSSVAKLLEEGLATREGVFR